MKQYQAMNNNYERKYYKKKFIFIRSFNERNTRCEIPFEIMGVDIDFSRAFKRIDTFGCNHKTNFSS